MCAAYLKKLVDILGVHFTVVVVVVVVVVHFRGCTHHGGIWFISFEIKLCGGRDDKRGENVVRHHRLQKRR